MCSYVIFKYNVDFHSKPAVLMALLDPALGLSSAHPRPTELIWAVAPESRLGDQLGPGKEIQYETEHA